MPRRHAFTVIEVVIVLALIALIIAMAVPRATRAHSAAARAEAHNNLKQIGLATHAYHDAHKRLPHNGMLNTWGHPGDPLSGSWLYQIAPFLEQDPLFKNPKAHMESRIAVYLCPARERPGFTRAGMYAGPIADYGLNPWINDSLTGSLSGPDRRIALTRITDGTSNTFMAGQMALRIPDYASQNAAPGSETFLVGGTGGTARGLFGHQQDGPASDYINHFGGPFSGGTLFVMCDGSTRQVGYERDLGGGLKPNDAAPAPDGVR